MSLRVKLLVFLLSLSVGAMAWAAAHCGPAYPDCGHVEGAACPSSGACTNLQVPGVSPGEGGAGYTCYNPGGGGDPGGGYPTPTAVPTATATPTPSWPTWHEVYGGEYSYGSTCQNGTEIDPVTTVLRDNANFDNAESRFIDIGLYAGPAPFTTLQHYRDNGGCVEGEISRGTNDGVQSCFPQVVCAEPRWHVRCNISSLPDLTGPNWASCSPHWDASDGSPIDECGHWVPAVYNGGETYGGSGFDAGKDWLWWQLVHDYGMDWLGVVFWDNREQMHQCAGAPGGDWTGSNGYVNHIRLDP